MVVLEDVDVDKIHSYQRKDDGVYPTAEGIKSRLGVFVFPPPAVVDIFGGESIDDDGQQYQPSETFPVSPCDPNDERYIECAPNTCAGPTRARSFV